MRMYRASFVAGFAAGFVAGARSGKETYDQIVKYAKTAFEHPAVQQARGTVQAQATGLAQKVSGQLADKVPQMAQSAAHSVTDRMPRMRRTDNGHKSETEASAFATTSGPAEPGSDSLP
ncbi:MAG: YtxH domain-containing protein [Streptosporangiaceae bacterium]